MYNHLTHSPTYVQHTLYQQWRLKIKSVSCSERGYENGGQSEIGLQGNVFYTGYSLNIKSLFTLTT